MMGTKKILSIVLVLGFILVLMSPAHEASIQQSVEELYESAVFKKDVEGDLKGAIELFEKILVQFPDSRKVAAKAQLQIGICSEKLGLEEAKKAYEKVVDQYPDQAETVRIAKQKLYLLNASSPAAEQNPSGLILKKVDIPDGTPSPDGKYICYIDWDTCDLLLFEIATGKKRKLTHAPEDFSEMAIFNPVWISGSDQLAYKWINKTGFRDLRIVNRDGTNTKILYSEEGRSVGSIAGMSEEKEIIFTLSSKKQPKIIASVSVKDKTFKVLKTIGNIDAWDFSLSPDKKYVAYNLRQSDNFMNSDIKVLSINGKQESLLVEHPANDTFIGWAPKGNYILFVSDRTGTTSLWAAAFKDGKSINDPILIQQQLGLFKPLGITDDGKLYYTIAQWGQDVYTAKLNLLTGEVLSPPQRINKLFQGRTTKAIWSPDGNSLAYFVRKLDINSPFNYRTLYLRSFKTNDEKEIPLEYQATISRSIKWAQDNNHIFLRGRNEEKGAKFFKLNVQNGVSEIILDSALQKKAAPDLDIYLQDWSEDGNFVYETVMNLNNKVDQRKADVVRTDIKKGIKNTIYQSTEPGLLIISLSPDEKRLALLKNSATKQILSIIPSNGGEEVELFQNTERPNARLSHLSWPPKEKGLFFIKSFSIEEGEEERKSELWYIPSFDGASPRKFDLEMYRIRYLNFHPDGQTIAFDSGYYSETEVWIMENFLNTLTESKK